MGTRQGAEVLRHVELRFFAALILGQPASCLDISLSTGDRGRPRPALPVRATAGDDSEKK